MDKEQEARKAYSKVNQEQFVIALQIQIFELQEKLVALYQHVDTIGTAVNRLRYKDE